MAPRTEASKQRRRDRRATMAETSGVSKRTVKKEEERAERLKRAAAPHPTPRLALRVRRPDILPGGAVGSEVAAGTGVGVPPGGSRNYHVAGRATFVEVAVAPREKSPSVGSSSASSVVSALSAGKVDELVSRVTRLEGALEQSTEMVKEMREEILGLRSLNYQLQRRADNLERAVNTMLYPDLL